MTTTNRLRTGRARGSLDRVPGHAHLRASDEDRERVVTRLRIAAAEGRIGSDELEHRVGVALTARTYAELEATISDLPAPRAPRPAPRRRAAAGWMLAAVRANPVLLLFAIPALAVSAAMVMAVMMMWVTVVVAVMIIGGRSRGPRPPWAYTRYAHARYAHARYGRPHGAAGRRGRGY